MEETKEFAILQGKIINSSITIENIISSILLGYFRPDNVIVFAAVMLNSSVIHFGGKLKVLNAIGVDRKVLEKLQKMGSIRNSFAHTNEVENFGFYFSKDTAAPKTLLSVMNSRGDIKNKNPLELYEEFEILYNDVYQELKVFLSNLMKED
ncbi:hypothetical protein [Maribacter cobaltidurans]|uniref:Uncharacterized protein n=1 Tax=Maribacter cobaltidurans TaxID=1178778 RepID=A0A223V125_9FLAO|nr:hypothetical protein [Maribacter cobaltidurans]ASV29002.1 hypothetical protein CJ263_01460 [Maribacter cobaltidurans]GGD72797.1 hypothetical protein GCM10011412_08020 [Maribacter cobaltidurans]